MNYDDTFILDGVTQNRKSSKPYYASIIAALIRSGNTHQIKTL